MSDAPLDRDALEQRLEVRRQELGLHLVELRRAALESLDLRKRVEGGVEQAKRRAAQRLDHLVRRARAQPGLVAVLAAGLGLLGVALWAVRRERRLRAWERERLLARRLLS